MTAERPNPIGKGRLQNIVTADANKRAIAPSRAMRWVSAAAFFEVLNCAEATGQISAYAIKGGFAVELRHSAIARTSEDIDLLLAGERHGIETLHSILPAAWDAFAFSIKGEEEREHVVRVDLQVRFNRVDWGTLKIDVIDAAISEAEWVSNIAIERFGLPEVGAVACLSRQYQIAEWIHATTRPAIEGKRKNRARNVVDLYLFDRLAPVDDDLVRAACAETFEREGAHAWPPVPDFPDSWATTIAGIVSEIGLKTTPEEMLGHVSAYIKRLAKNS